MPSSKVLDEFRKGSLHSGSKSGPEVTDIHQARAIMISKARKEGVKIPKRKSSRSRGRSSSR